MKFIFASVYLIVISRCFNNLSFHFQDMELEIDRNQAGQQLSSYFQSENYYVFNLEKQ